MKTAKRLAAVLMVIFFLMPQYTARTDEKYVALTFDDGPAGTITQRLLDGLAERNVRATFFLCCYRIAQYPEPVRRMGQEGHEIGIHGCSHLYFTQMTESQLETEITCTAGSIADLTGTSPHLLRPPGGLYNEAVRRAAENAGLSLILWSIDPEDWNPAVRKRTADYVIQRAKHGDIILLHDLSDENTAAALKIVDSLTAEGFHFCTVSELAERAGTSLLPGKIYRHIF